MSTPAPAWYPSPDDDRLERWWDGTGWTDHTRPVGSGAEPPSQRPVARQPVASVPNLPAPQQNDAIVRSAPSPVRREVRSAVPRTFPAQRVAVAGDVPPPSGGPGNALPVDEAPSGPRQRAIAFAALVVGLVLMVVGTYAALTTGGANRVQSGEATTIGTIYKHDLRSTDDGSAKCSPAAAFTIGTTTYRAEYDGANSCVKIGTSVTVIYNVAHPGDDSARVQTSETLLKLLWLLPLFGLGMALVALASLGAFRRWTSR